MTLNLLTVIQVITHILEWLSPPLAARWARHLFFSPRTTQREIPRIPSLQLSWCHYVNSSGKPSQVRVYTAGTGPAVLLVHGWEGAALSHSELASHLLKHGYRVTLFDLPGHGLSPGKQTNVVEVGEIIQKLADQEGSLHAIVGHSFGAACAGYAISQGLVVNYFASIAAPPRVSFMIDHFCRIIGASNQLKQPIIKQIEMILGGTYEQASLTELAPFKQLSGLIIHDHKDRMIPFELAEEFATAWPQAQFITTQGLGHSRILQSETVAKAVTSWLST